MPEFKREVRYIVIKKKHLDEETAADLQDFLESWQIPTVECVVVERHWPEYELVWSMIESRVTGK